MLQYNDDSPNVHHSHVTAILRVFSDVLDFIEAECSIYQNVQYFIRSKNCVLDSMYWSSWNQEKLVTE